MAKKILLVEDNEDFGRVLKMQLEKGGDEVTHATDGESGLSEAQGNAFSLILLDLGLPKKDGLEVLHALRESGVQVPVIILTSRSEEIDKITGLDLGADDYITKPFTYAELTARINALFRRIEVSQGSSTAVSSSAAGISIGEIELDLESRIALLRGEKVHLTPKEYELLIFFMQHPGQAFSRDQLIEEIWQYEAGDYSQSVNNIIGHLRKKIEEDPAEPKYILTVRGYGYRFVRQEEI